ncbi:MAG: methyltransferase domain-containing protein [Gemmatimonadota bacterium]
MSPTDSRSPAQIYEEDFVPAVFGPWGSTMSDLAGLTPGERVLDVACGTGALTRVAAARVGPAGSITGLDANPEMLEVAQRVAPGLEWRRGRAEALPFDDDNFDAVVSQFGFMFFDDQVGALREMMRVLRPGGRLAVSVCDALDHSPGYAVLTVLLQRLFGDEVARAFAAPFTSGDPRRLQELCRQAGIASARVQRVEGAVRFASVADLVSTERACAWTLGGLLDDDQFQLLLEHAEESLRPFVEADGRLNLSMPCLVITAERPR